MTLLPVMRLLCLLAYSSGAGWFHISRRLCLADRCVNARCCAGLSICQTMQAPESPLIGGCSLTTMALT